MIRTTLAVAAFALIATSGLASARTIHTTPETGARQVETFGLNGARNSYNLFAPEIQRAPHAGSLAWREFHALPTNNLDD